MKLTKIDLFYNTPFTDFQNTIHFSSDSERDDFFTGRYEMRSIDAPFNFVKDRLTLNAPINTLDTYGLNYLRFKSDIDGGRWYYAFVMNAEYINDGVTRIYLVLDAVMTFTQGDFTSKIKNAYVKRQSLNADGYEKYRYMLASNSDVLNFPKYYTLKVQRPFDTFYVIFMASVDLTSDFGTPDNPKLKTSKGGTHDQIVSPLSLYACKSKSQFTALMAGLSSYPWVSQNISSIAIVPADFVTDSNLRAVSNSYVSDMAGLEFYEFIDGSTTHDFENLMNYPGRIPLNLCFGFSETDPAFLLRGEYASIELTSWTGQRAIYDPAFLKDYVFTVKAQSVFGYHNEIRTYVEDYQTSPGGEQTPTNIPRGTYVNNGLVFDAFDDIPILVDQYRLAKASSAHQRAYNDSNQITGQAKRVFDGSNSLKDRLSAALSLTTSLIGGNVVANAVSRFNSEHDYYRQQQAQLADMAIAAPSVGSQVNSQSFGIAKGTYGVTAAFSAISDGAADVVKRYHGTFGFDFEGQNVPIEPITSMPFMNYLQFSGNWNLIDIPANFIQQLQVTFENGVKLWHNRNLDNPFTEDLINNK